MTSRSSGGAGFASLWISQGAGELGAQLGSLAVPLLAVYSLHADAGLLGLLSAAQWLPFLVLALPFGLLVDRGRRRPLLVIADLARVVILAVLVLLSAGGVLTAPVLLLLVLLLGAGTVLFEVSYQSLLPALVAVDGLEGANTRLQATAAVAQAGGPALAGLLVQLLGATRTIAGQGLCLAISAVAILRIRAVEPPVERPEGRIRAQLLDGIRYAWRDPYLRANLGFSALYNPFGEWVLVLLTLRAVHGLGMTSAELGAVLAVGALGAVAGGVLARPVARRIGTGAALMTCAAVECAALLVLPAAEPSWGHPLVVGALAGALALNGAGTALSSVLLVTIRQLRIPDRLFGRVNAGMRWITYGGIALGAAGGGLAGELLGTRDGLLLGAVGGLGTIVWVAVSPLPRIRSAAALAIPERRLSAP